MVTGSGEIEVDAAALRAQAAEVERIAGDVTYARDAAGSLNLAGGAFGLMCSFLVAPAMAVTAIARETMAETSRMLRREADALRETADDFEGIEDDVGAEMRTLGREIV